MKTKILLSAIGAAALALAINACQETNVKPTSSIASQEVTKPNKFIGATTLAACKTKKDVTYHLKNWELNWVKDTVYCLCGDVRVDSTKALNIASGVLVRGIKEAAGSLTVLPGASINALGLSNDPIIFTSSQNVSARAPQDWGGLIVLGHAQTNRDSRPAIEGFPVAGAVAGAEGAPKYGSVRTINTFNAESSGTLQYVRIEFGGVPLPTVSNSEKNGLTLGGVGSGTIIDHVQTSSGGDDGFEWFGGTVNAKFLISHKNIDDDFDTDFGFQGKVQYGIVSRDPARGDISGSNGFESDNDGTGSTNTPFTQAIFSNFTIIGPMICSSTGVNTNFNDGVHIRRRSGIDIYNTLIVGWKRHQLFADPANIVRTPQPDGAVLDYNRAVRYQPLVATAIINEPAAANNVWSYTGNHNTAVDAFTCDTNADSLRSVYRRSGLNPSAWTLTAVNVTPIATAGTYTSPILATGVNANSINAFFDANTTTASGSTTYFIGARRQQGPDNGWNLSSGWVNWQPETQPYANDGTY